MNYPIRSLFLLGATVLSFARPVAAELRDYAIGGYIPGLAPAVVGCCLYAILGFLAVLHLVRHGQNWMLPLIIGLFAFACGLAARAANHSSPYVLGPFVAQQVILLACPCFFLATSYFSLDKLQEHLRVEKCLLLPAKWVVRIFITSDIVTFFLQCAGGGTQASRSADTIDLGKKLSTIGLSIQLASFSLFTILLLFFGIRVRSRYPEKWNYVRQQSVVKSLLGAFSSRKVDDWKVMYGAAWLVALGVMIRSIYRIVEYKDGYRGTLWLHEAYFYFLDVLVLFLAMSVHLVVWPPRFLPRDSVVRGPEGALDVGVVDEKRRWGWKRKGSAPSDV